MVSAVRTPHASRPVPDPRGSLYRQMSASRRRTWLVWSSCVLGLIALIAVAALAAPLRADAAGTLNQAANELAAADVQRLAARAERAQAKTAMRTSARQLKELRKVVGDEARGMYMSGSPSGLAALVEQNDANDLLDQIATLDQLAKANNDAITNMVIRQKEYVTAQAALVKAERDIDRSQAEIKKKIEQATELRDVRAEAKDALDKKISDLLGEAAMLRNTQQQTAANQSGQRRTGTKCDLS